MRLARSASKTSLLLVVLLCALVLLASPAASLETENDPFIVTRVESSDDSLRFDVTYLGDGSPSEAEISVGDDDVSASVSEIAEDPGTAVAVVFDNSDTVPNGTVQISKDLVAQLAPGDNGIASLSLVTTGKNARRIGRLETNIDSILDPLDGVLPTGRNDLFEATEDALTMLDAASTESRALVMIVNSQNDGARPTYTELSNLAADVGAQVHIVTSDESTIDEEALDALYTQQGGSTFSGSDEEFEEAGEQIVNRISSRYRYTVSDVPKLTSELEPLSVTIGDDTALASFRPGITSKNAETLTYIVPNDGTSFLSGSGKYLIVAVSTIAVMGFFLALGLLFMKNRDGLDQALRHYEESYGSPVIESQEDSGMATSAVLQRAVEVTGDFAERQGVLTKVEKLLERANLPLRAPEALFFYVAFVLVAVVAVFAATGNVFLVLGVAVLTVIAPSFIVDFLARRRLKQFNAVLPDMLQLLAGTLRAGYSIAQGIEAVAGEVHGPMGDELGRAVTEARLGKPLEDALYSVAQRTGSEDFEWAVMAIGIQREVGGNLAELLMTVSETMVQRERLRRDVAGLTAEGRMSAAVLGILPPGLGLAMYVINRAYIEQLFSGTGLYLLGAAFLLMIIGFAWMKKTITIEV